MTAPALLEHRFADTLPELSLDWQAATVSAPTALALDEDLAAELGLDPDWLRSPAGLRFLVGNELPDGARPVAQGYAGHQFGGYSPRLGDGRALLLGEIAAPDGTLRDVHLKGSGRTPFSRGGDGWATAGPMLREHLMATAMFALGVPTTRSLAVTGTGQQVARESLLAGAVLTRMASSHLRIGTFQYAAALVAGEHAPADLLGRLTRHAIDRHYPQLAEADRPALALLQAVCDAQARLVAQWMSLGFVHGVLNTDNVLISGETIDYGPCAFTDTFDPSSVFSSIDEGGRYAFGHQPGITQWNLARFAEALLPSVDENIDTAVELASEVINTFPATYDDAYAGHLARKLGLDAVDRPLVKDLIELMQAETADITLLFGDLTRVAGGEVGRFADRPAYTQWLGRWLAHHPDPCVMAAANPVYIPRNHLVQEALDAAITGDLEPFNRMLQVVREPFTARVGFEDYTKPAPQDFGDYVTFCGT
ncbi:uncharacterized protein YdiU (UPF0061 family) [Branchiibius hedensis]|uniref:Protein nucleotidyltransferase YdiU n=1 Tax=Branchiibius hedensis TaxID=672460 RepID=A0A2Y9BT61_9MICO|nr:uncharacterized protein YdiU (UPF0061 family) [Branchiibius hedensis]SSA33492.1 Uncharacterized conserved protein YdiU, UPF0061 family [Branchiibius hedensis]